MEKEPKSHLLKVKKKQQIILNNKYLYNFMLKIKMIIKLLNTFFQKSNKCSLLIKMI